MINLKKVASILAIIMLCGNLQAQTIRVNKVVGDKELLLFNILKLAISKVDKDAQFVQNNEELSISRVFSSVENNTLDVMWAGTSSEYENTLSTVRIPVLKGMLGYRVFIIRQADENKFAQINSLTDLKQVKAGQGKLWGDRKVLESAGLPTVNTLKYPNLFPMLEGGRYDYFPRAIHEPWVEVKDHQNLNLVVDKHVLLIYPYAMYFFVNKSNQKLHDQIYQGFEKAIADGSFNKLFFNNSMVKDALSMAELKNRTIIRIPNPYMSPETPYDRKEFWLDINKL